jgi:ribosomal protein S14
MGIKNNILNIKKEFIKKKKFLKTEIKKLILKSIINNQTIKPIIRANANYKLSKFIQKSTISKQKNNICMKTGRIGGVYKITNFSRHFMKKLFDKNNLQNLKIKNW